MQRYERFLRQPDVGLALDPEWSMRAGQVPGQTIGSTDARTVNRVSAYLAALVRRHRLPQKLLVVHQFTPQMVRNRDARRRTRRASRSRSTSTASARRPRSARSTAQLHGRPPFYSGFKLFYDEDVGLLAPRQVLALRPAPDLVTYQ